MVEKKINKNKRGSRRELFPVPNSRCWTLHFLMSCPENEFPLNTVNIGLCKQGNIH